jgi:hypothetical protein
MLRIGLGICLTTLSLAIYNFVYAENTCFVITTHYYLLFNLFYILPFIAVFLKFKIYSSIHSIFLCTLYLYAIEFDYSKSIISCFFNFIQYDILRYVIFYMYIVLCIPNNEKGIHKLPYAAVISNCSYVIERRSHIFMEMFSNETLKYASLGCAILGMLLTLTTRTNFEKSDLYNDVTRYRRMFTQSSLLFCSLFSTGLLTQHINIDSLDNNSMYDIVPLATSFLIILLNQQYLKYVPFSIYIYFGIIVNLGLTICTHFWSSDNSFQKIAVVLSYGCHFMISDPSRYMFYILHSQEVVPYFIAGDIAALIIARTLLQLIDTIYVNYVVLIFWTIISTFGKKYHIKDKFCERCVSVLEV